ncbi:hypothetical protein NPIL_472851 [Nephila pilipes]|uniref:Uncharacterized protein n=1 Tax=Nephila pilipes TaxID=299642 RepID=A0A8X6USW9_NEPPI|nr:hypothetical protein NPIL_472851 [Nephila pilipes]
MVWPLGSSGSSPEPYAHPDPAHIPSPATSLARLADLPIIILIRRGYPWPPGPPAKLGCRCDNNMLRAGRCRRRLLIHVIIEIAGAAHHWRRLITRLARCPGADALISTPGNDLCRTSAPPVSGVAAPAPAASAQSSGPSPVIGTGSYPGYARLLLRVMFVVNNCKPLGPPNIHRNPPEPCHCRLLHRHLLLLLIQHLLHSLRNHLLQLPLRAAAPAPPHHSRIACSSGAAHSRPAPAPPPKPAPLPEPPAPPAPAAAAAPAPAAPPYPPSPPAPPAPPAGSCSAPAIGSYHYDDVCRGIRGPPVGSGCSPSCWRRHYHLPLIIRSVYHRLDITRRRYNLHLGRPSSGTLRHHISRPAKLRRHNIRHHPRSSGCRPSPSLAPARLISRRRHNSSPRPALFRASGAIYRRRPAAPAPAASVIIPGPLPGHPAPPAHCPAISAPAPWSFVVENGMCWVHRRTPP